MKKEKIQKKLKELEAEGKEISRDWVAFRKALKKICQKSCKKKKACQKILNGCDKEVAKTRKKLAEVRRLLKKKLKEGYIWIK